MAQQGDDPTDARASRVIPVAAAVAPADRPLWPGTFGPVGHTPRRHRGSIRRTTSIDIVHAEGDHDLYITGSGRDATTDLTGALAVVATATVAVRVDVPTYELREIRTDPPVAGIERLQGASATKRYRQRMRDVLPDAGDTSLVGLLLDDVSMSTLISATSLLRRDAVPEDATWTTGSVGVCAGWVEGGVLARSLIDGNRSAGEGPAAPLDDLGDDLAWHAMPALGVGSLRRRRRIDVVPGDAGAATVDVFFRDVYVEPDGTESAVHEYTVEVALTSDGIVGRIDVVPRVLPGPQCPNAVASAQRVVGTSVHQMRATVDGNFKGTTTCTHLNDVLRSLADVGWLLRAVHAG